MAKIHILLDIDGTINPRGMSAAWRGQWSENTILNSEEPVFFESFPQNISSLTLRTNKELLDNLVRISEGQQVEMHWFTAWGHDARTIFCPKVGLDGGLAWNVIMPDDDSEDMHEDSQNWWKTNTLKSFLDSHPDDQVLWIDDMVDIDDQMEDTHVALCEQFPDRLAIIGVPGHLGITPDIFSFIDRIVTSKWISGFMAWEF